MVPVDDCAARTKPRGQCINIIHDKPRMRLFGRLKRGLNTQMQFLPPRQLEPTAPARGKGRGFGYFGYTDQSTPKMARLSLAPGGHGELDVVKG